MIHTGASLDLQYATDVAFQIVCTYGMEDDQLIILKKDEVLQSALAGEYTAKVNEILKTEMKNTQSERQLNSRNRVEAGELNV